jgi:hypothetical protein
MRLTILFSCLAILIANLWGQQTQDDHQKSLDDVIVKETFQVGTEEEKLPVILNADFSDLVEVKERIQWSSVSWDFEGEKPGFDAFSMRLSSPELANIAPQPAKVFAVNFEELARWEMEIFSSDGQKFRSISGEGKPPKSIAWDGLGNDNTPLIPGESYSYSFKAIDHAGNKRTLPGPAFSIPALYLNDADAIWVGLSYATVFSPNGFGLTHQANDFATEIVNFIYYFADEGSISVSSNHPQTDQFLALIATKLGQEISFFQKERDDKFQDKCIVMRIK